MCYNTGIDCLIKYINIDMIPGKNVSYTYNYIKLYKIIYNYI